MYFSNCRSKLYDVHKLCHSILAALHPDPVRNLSVTVDANIPAAMLSWIPPANIKSTDELNEYHIRVFGNEHHNETTFIVSTTGQSVCLRRESGLVPLETYHFQVWAQSGHEEGELQQVSKYYGNILH